ncbi:MAG TPA: helix-turn-helix domain-containing protein [Terriglobales bacterium]|nr:helix-turn-helix domain-containing protein [Terriglobales bacterium]
MSVTGYHRAPIAEREQFLAEIDRLIGSHVLHGSESLCKLLRYLADHALHHPGVPLKEYQIATEVFGRPADFDPQSDSTIRVQAGRLRMKLAEYYSSDGAEDPIIVELPKGTYVLSFHHRAHGALHEARLEAMPQAQPRVGWAAIALSVLLAAALAVIAILIENRNKPEVGAAAYTETAPAVFRVFWGGFLYGPEEPWVIFSNGAFVGRPETGMRYFDAARDSRNLILDHYTGVGEVLAVHDLDRVFALLRRQIRVKRGSLFSLDDAKNNDLIFVGSPAENLTLRDIPSTEQFVFQRLDSGPRKGDLAVVNLHPQAGEDKYFFGSRSNTPLTEDYSVIALVRGFNPSQWVMILAGTTTLGTQAAVEYVCSETSLKDLLGRLNVSQPGEMKPFEAVLRVKVTRGVPVESSIVALRSGS